MIERIAVSGGDVKGIACRWGADLMRHRRGQRFALGGKVYDLNMLGDHQSENAALALEAYRSIAPMGTRAGKRSPYPALGGPEGFNGYPLAAGSCRCLANEHGLAGLCETIAHYDLAICPRHGSSNKSRGGQLARLISMAEAVVYTSADDPRANRDFEGGEDLCHLSPSGGHGHRL